MKGEPTFLGYVAAITGVTVSVRRSEALASGLAIIGGQTYRVAQVGAFVRIPQGYIDLYGVVSEVGVSAAPEVLRGTEIQAQSWMTVQLVGESVGSSFERGIAQYPSVNDEVHIVTDANLRQIYDIRGPQNILVGRLANAEGTLIGLDLDKLVTRHCAVLGSTGSGKSTTVASILRSIAASGGGSHASFPRSRIVVLDIHGEYGKALHDIASIFRIDAGYDESELYVPYWAIGAKELVEFLMGKLEDKQLMHVFDKIVELKARTLQHQTFEGVSPDALTIDAPVPYSLKQMWLELLDPEIRTVTTQGGDIGAVVEEGNAATLTPPKYRAHGLGSAGPFLNSRGVFGIRRQLEHLRSRLLDRQFAFLLHPGALEPDLNGVVSSDLDSLLRAWLGHERPITILDLSGVPSGVLARLIGSLLKVIYEALCWGKAKSEGGIERPLLIVMEEAHRYLGRDAETASGEMVRRIVKEGRKYGIGAAIVSQRPSEIDETVLSQIGSFITLRLSNSGDRSRVKEILPDSLAGVVDMLPVLRTGEAIIVGEAARLPTRCRIFLPDEALRPDSEDPLVAEQWAREPLSEDYNRLVASWRAQLHRYTRIRVNRAPVRDGSGSNGDQQVQREAVASSSIVAVGYDGTSEILEVEFLNGRVYQYYNVPSEVYSEFMSASSKGAFLNYQIKGRFAYSQV